MIRYLLCSFFFFGFLLSVQAQELKPGFNSEEYLDLIKMSATDNPVYKSGYIPRETNYSKVYSSPEMGLRNQWDLWLSKDKTIIFIDIRGSVPGAPSWLENLYSAMIPAAGTLHISDKNTFTYKFASDPRALVHVGWALGVGFIAGDVMEKIRNWHDKGVHQVVVAGHSQGGVLALLLSAYLRCQVEDGKLPRDIVMKTYASAAPKPGNLYFAYDLENASRGGWTFTIVNSIDWVPETPFSIQTVADINRVSPFVNVRHLLRKQKPVIRFYGNYVYGKMSKSTRRAQRRFDKYLGKATSKQVKKYLPEYVSPPYAKSFDYTRAGTPVVFEPDADFYKQFPDTGSNIFRFHLFEPYYYLANKYR